MAARSQDCGGVSVPDFIPTYFLTGLPAGGVLQYTANPLNQREFN
jgi:hypothetical protein